MDEGKTPPQRIAFRTDAAQAIGAGHLRRCLTLAEALRADGHDVLFVCRAFEKSLNADVAAAGFPLIELPPAAGSTNTEDARETCAALVGHGPIDVMVVDHYGLGATWETEVRRVASRVAVIDDLADRAHACDVLIDVTPAQDAAVRYAGLVSDGAVKLLGPRYALLRPEFRALRGKTGARSGEIARVFVSFGGSDEQDRCGTAVGAIRAALGPNTAIDVVLGRLAPHAGRLQGLAETDPQLSVHIDTPHVARLMAVADLAIGAAGTMSWERACLGLPALVAQIAENQSGPIQALVQAGCAIAVPGSAEMWSALESRLSFVSENPGLLRLMGDAATSLVDGLGARRVARIIAPLALSLRPATSKDSEDIWQWRNDPTVRAASKEPAVISRDAHDTWFARVLADADRHLLIAEDADGAVGVLRFDIQDDAALVSIYLTPAGRGRGLAEAILKAGEGWLRSNRPELGRIEAEILPGNAASVAAFEAADYGRRLLRYERDLSDA